MQLIKRFWNDEAGFVVSSELVLIATVLVLGMLAGLVTVRDAVIQELGDIANAVGIVSQSYSYSGVTAHSASTAGTQFIDLADECETTQTNGANSEPACMAIDTVAGSTAG